MTKRNTRRNKAAAALPLWKSYESHATRGNTRANRKMKHANNYLEWHNQAKNILKKAQLNTQMLGIAGRAAAAFGNEPASSLPAKASAQERSAAIRKRLLNELGNLKNSNKNRRNTLKRALREYGAAIPNLEQEGGGCSACAAAAAAGAFPKL